MSTVRMLARLWQLLSGSMKWRILWFVNAKFIAGVTGIVRDDTGKVLLLKHRFWPAATPWGFPSGYVRRGEAFEAAIIREVQEETGLEVAVGDLIKLTTGKPLRMYAAYNASLVGGNLRIDSKEILEARWFSPTELPAGLLTTHRLLIESSGAHPRKP